MHKIVIIGSGPAGLTAAIYTARANLLPLMIEGSQAGGLAIIHRRDKLRASKIMQDKAMNNEKISFRWNSVVEEVLGDAVVTGLRLRDSVNNDTSTLDCKGVFVAIGHTPNTHIFRGQIALDANGYVRTSHGTATSVPGVFAAGDVQDPHYRQAITAAGTGCMAAMDAERFLEAES